MKVLSIIDSFKGTLISSELGSIMTNVLRKKGYEAQYIPISDGGDGFLEAIESAVKTKRVKVNVLNPLLKPIETHYLYDEKSSTAYIELAKSSGIYLLTKDELNPYITSTYGLGQTINKAIEKGVKRIIIGLGGSATNDGGSGMLEAMGCLFYDENHELMQNLSGGVLDKIAYTDPTGLYDRIKGIEFIVLSDVKNPLLYENGATYVFSKQKGAGINDIEILEKKMQKYAKVIEGTVKQDYSTESGTGAAGGVGFALMSIFNAKFYSGIDYILDLVDFDNLIKDYDYIITGEGKIDSQSLGGKVIFGIIQRSKGNKIILVCAVNELDEKLISDKNIVKIYSIVNNVASAQESMKKPGECFRKLCETITF